MFVIDEIDMLIDNGFYDTLIKITEAFKDTCKQTLMFSATLNARKIINLQKLVLKSPEIIELNFNNTKSVLPTLLQQF